MKDIKGIIFDLDGTLLNTLSDITLGINMTMKHLSLPECSEEEVVRRIGNGARRLVERCVGEGHTEEFIDDALRLYSAAYAECFMINTRPYARIYDTIERLGEAGIRMAVLSNKQDRQTTELAAALLPDRFCDVRGHRDGAAHKPDPSVTLEMIAGMGLRPEEVAFVGDSEVDIATGANAGTYKIGVSWGFRSTDLLKKSGADLIIDDPHRLLDLI